MNYMAIPSIVSALFCLGLGTFVGSRNPRRPANLWFTLGMGALALTEFSAFMIGTQQDPQDKLYWGKVAISGEAFLPGSWLLFSLTFARSKVSLISTRWWPTSIAFFLVPLGFLGYLGSPTFVSMHSGESPVPYFQVDTMGDAFYVIFLLSLVIILMNLEQTYRASTGTARHQIKYIMLGTGAILAFETYMAGQVLLFSAISLDSLPVRSVAILMGNTFILFAIVRHGLLDVDVFISRYVIYNSVTLLAAGLYFILVGTVVFGMQRFVAKSYSPIITFVIFASFLAVIVLSLSNSLRRKMETFINVHFFRNKHDYRVRWREFTQAVGTKLSLPELLQSFVDWLSETIGTNEVSLWLLDRDRRVYYLACNRGFESAPTTWTENSRIVNLLKEKSGAMVVDRKDSLWEPILQEYSQFFDSHLGGVLVPMRSNQELVGFGIMGQKITKDPYDYHDLELVTTIFDQATGQIHRVRLSEDLTLMREMETFNVLSSFVIHDLKNYTSTLSLVAQNATAHGENPAFQKDAIHTIRNTAEKMNELIRRVSVTRKGLALSRSEVDSKKLIESIISGFARTLRDRIHWKKCDLLLIWADPEQLSKVIQNLVINACQAIDESGVVNIETTTVNGEIHLSVTDNGYGMTQEFIATKLFKPLRSTKRYGWGIGLYQCQQIVQSHGGRIEVESEEGKGSTFTVVLPGKRV